jgi:hypothetical protein
MTNTTDDKLLDLPVWGATKIGEIVNRSPRQTFHLLETGRLPATKVASKWVSTPRRLLAHILGDAK